MNSVNKAVLDVSTQPLASSAKINIIFSTFPAQKTDMMTINGKMADLENALQTAWSVNIKFAKGAFQDGISIKESVSLNAQLKNIKDQLWNTIIEEKKCTSKTFALGEVLYAKITQLLILTVLA